MSAFLAEKLGLRSQIEEVVADELEGLTVPQPFPYIVGINLISSESTSGTGYTSKRKLNVA
jgi:hypothetical protein